MPAQLLVNALSLGSFYALTALGFSLIFGVTNAFNLAHGELILLAGYLAYAMEKVMGAPFFLVFPLCMMLMPLATMLLHGLIRYIREPFVLNSLVVTFGVALVLQNALLLCFSADYRLLGETPQRIELPLFGLSVTHTQVLLIGLSISATAALHLLLHKTFLGKALRATIQDREAAILAGIDVGHMSLIAFGIGGGLIGLAGPLYARTAYVHPFGGTEATLIAIIVTIFAGAGSPRGVLLGGWTLGIAESLTDYTLGIGWRELASSLLLIVLLLLTHDGSRYRVVKLHP